MNRKNLLLAVVALLLVLLGNWLSEEGVKRVEELRTDTALQPQQDYYLNGFTITVFDEQGQLQQKLQAEQLGHNEQSQSSSIVQPHLQLFSHGKLQWQLTAAQGQLEQQRDEFTLKGGVTLLQHNVKLPLQLQTATLRLQPGTGRAETDQPVTLQQGQNRIDAVGMRIEEQGQRLQLLSQVRAAYATQLP